MHLVYLRKLATCPHAERFLHGPWSNTRAPVRLRGIATENCLDEVGVALEVLLSCSRASKQLFSALETPMSYAIVIGIAALFYFTVRPRSCNAKWSSPRERYCPRVSITPDCLPNAPVGISYWILGILCRSRAGLNGTVGQKNGAKSNSSTIFRSNIFCLLFS